jgi:hypothetical protein
MEQAATAPETDLGSEEPQGTPVAEQAPEQAPAPTPQVAPDKLGQAGSPSQFQAEFTRRSQENAAYKQALGLAKDSGRDEVLAAISRLQASKVTGEEDTDPRVVEYETKYLQSAWKTAEVYYPGVAPAAREFAEYLQTEGDPEAIAGRFYEILQRFAAGPEEQPAAAAEPTPEAPAMHLSESDAGPSQSQQSDAELEELRGSGKVAEAVNILMGRHYKGTRTAPR